MNASDSYIQYDPPGSATSWSGFFRFGYPTNFALLFSDNPQERDDYVIGLIVIGAITGAIFLAWAIFLLVATFCRCCNVGGFLTGTPFVVKKFVSEDEMRHDLELMESTDRDSSKAKMETPDSQDTGDEQPLMGGSAPPGANVNEDPTEQFQEEGQGGKKNVVATVAPNTRQSGGCHRGFSATIRIIFLIAYACFIAATVLLVRFGTMNLEMSLQSVGNSSNMVNDLAKDVLRIYGNTFMMNNSANQAEWDRIMFLNETTDQNFCPLDPVMQNVPDDLKTSIADARNLMEPAVNEIKQGASEIADLAQTVERLSSQITQASTFELQSWVSLVILIPCIVIPSILAIAALLALCGVQIPCAVLCIINWFVVPLFLFIVLVSAIVAASSSILAGVNTDFCLPSTVVQQSPLDPTPSPNDSFRNILSQVGWVPGSFESKATNFFLNQCLLDPNPLDQFDNYTVVADDALAELGNIQSYLKNETSLLVTACGRQYSTLTDVIAALMKFANLVAVALVKLLTLTTCQSLVQIYVEAVYDSACTYSVTAVVWIWCTSLCMTFFGMLMVTARSSYKNDQIQYVEAGKFPSSYDNSKHSSQRFDEQGQDVYAQTGTVQPNATGTFDYEEEAPVKSIDGPKDQAHVY